MRRLRAHPSAASTSPAVYETGSGDRFHNCSWCRSAQYVMTGRRETLPSQPRTGMDGVVVDDAVASLGMILLVGHGVTQASRRGASTSSSGSRQSTVTASSPSLGIWRIAYSDLVDVRDRLIDPAQSVQCCGHGVAPSLDLSPSNRAGVRRSRRCQVTGCPVAASTGTSWPDAPAAIRGAASACMVARPGTSSLVAARTRIRPA